VPDLELVHFGPVPSPPPRLQTVFIDCMLTHCKFSQQKFDIYNANMFYKIPQQTYIGAFNNIVLLMMMPLDVYESALHIKRLRDNCLTVSDIYSSVFPLFKNVATKRKCSALFSPKNN